MVTPLRRHLHTFVGPPSSPLHDGWLGARSDVAYHTACRTTRRHIACHYPRTIIPDVKVPGTVLDCEVCAKVSRKMDPPERCGQSAWLAAFKCCLTPPSRQCHALRSTPKKLTSHRMPLTSSRPTTCHRSPIPDARRRHRHVGRPLQGRHGRRPKSRPRDAGPSRAPTSCCTCGPPPRRLTSTASR